MEIVLWIAGVGAVLALAIWLVTEHFYRVAFLRHAEEHDDVNALGKPWTAYLPTIRDGVQWLIDHTTETVKVQSFDGLMLSARLVERKGARGTVLMCHGYRSRGYLDFSCVFPFYYRLGLNLVVIDERACGDSEGDTITFGLNERCDVKTWTEWINGRFGETRPVILAGISMGCASVVMSLATGLPDNVKGIIADCGYTSVWRQLAYILRRDYGLPPFPILYWVNGLFRRRTGRDLREADTLPLLRQSDIPVLFIHGGADRFVPTDFSVEGWRACAADKDLLIVDSAAHATSALADPAAYRRHVAAFVERVVPPEGG